MKPRLQPAPLTHDDTQIWCQVVLSMPGANAGAFFANSGFHADRRDADLMLQAQEIAQFGPAAIELYGIACRGWNSEAYWIEDTDDGEGVWRR